MISNLLTNDQYPPITHTRIKFKTIATSTMPMASISIVFSVKDAMFIKQWATSLQKTNEYIPIIRHIARYTGT